MRILYLNSFLKKYFVFEIQYNFEKYLKVSIISLVFNIQALENIRHLYFKYIFQAVF